MVFGPSATETLDGTTAAGNLNAELLKITPIQGVGADVYSQSYVGTLSAFCTSGVFQTFSAMLPVSAAASADEATGGTNLAPPIGGNTLVGNPDCNQATWPFNNPPCNDFSTLVCLRKCDCTRDQSAILALCKFQNNINDCAVFSTGTVVGAVAGGAVAGACLGGVGAAPGAFMGLLTGMVKAGWDYLRCKSGAENTYSLDRAAYIATYNVCRSDCGG